MPGAPDGEGMIVQPGSRRSGPVDPRLLEYARGTRQYLLLTVALGGLTAGLGVGSGVAHCQCNFRRCRPPRGPGAGAHADGGPGGGHRCALVCGLARRASCPAGIGIREVRSPQRPGAEDRPSSAPPGSTARGRGAWWCWPPAGSTPSTATSPGTSRSCSSPSSSR